MTTLVTGGAGYIGSHMVHELVDAGEPVIVVDNLTTGFRSALPTGVPLFVGDCGDQDLVAPLISAFGVSAIIHFAASVVVPESLHDPLGYYRNNTMATRNLLQAAVGSGVRQFIFSSTAAVYGNPVSVPVTEDAPTRPVSPYGTSKLMSEIMLHDVAAAHDFRYVALRYFNVAGADPHLRTGLATPHATHLLKASVEAALGLRPKLEVFGTHYPTRDGTCIRDFIHVSDLVRAHSAVLNYLRQGGPCATFNCGYGRGYSVLEVVDAVSRVSGRTLPVVFAEARAGDLVEVVADVARIRAAIDWAPRFDDLNTIAAHALAWEQRLLQQRPQSDAEAVSA